MLRVFSALFTLAASRPFARASPVISSATPLAQWQQLNWQVGGRLFPGVPFASTCFATGSQTINKITCGLVKSGYLDERMSFVYLQPILYLDDVG